MCTPSFSALPRLLSSVSGGGFLRRVDWGIWCRHSCGSSAFLGEPLLHLFSKHPFCTRGSNRGPQTLSPASEPCQSPASSPIDWSPNPALSDAEISLEVTLSPKPRWLSMWHLSMGHFALPWQLLCQPPKDSLLILHTQKLSDLSGSLPCHMGAKGSWKYKLKFSSPPLLNQKM